MRRDPLLESLIAELDGLLAGAQAARRLAGELLQSSDATLRAAGRGVDAAMLAMAPSLRYSGMTVPEAAARLGLGEEQVRRLLRRGLLTGISFGGRVGWRLPRAAVEAIAEEWDAQRLRQAAARTPRKSERP